MIPAFGTFGPYCINAVADELPVISDNLISGTWTPSVISTAVAGVNTYLFVADEGQCAQNYNQEVEVKPVIIPVRITSYNVCYTKLLRILNFQKV